MAPTAGILQVIHSFYGELAGASVSFRVGELIEADHPAVRKWPDHFGPVIVHHRMKSEPRIEKATAGPGEKRGA